MLLRNLAKRYDGKLVLGSPYVGILASQIAAETATGDHGPGILYNESVDPVYAGKYLHAWVTNPPTVGSLIVAENGEIEALGLPDGSHVFGYDLYVDGVYDSASAFTVAVGVVDATAAGATLTGTATLTPGSATGESSATVPGATLTGASSFVAGLATGGIGGADATVDGITLTATSLFVGGVATGAQNATFPGVVMIGVSRMIPGAATNGEPVTEFSEIRRYTVLAETRSYSIAIEDRAY